MKRICTLLVLCTSLSSLAFSQRMVFDRTYGEGAYGDARSIALTGEGCLVFTGLSMSGTDPLGDMYLTKINAAGAVIWTHYYGREKEDGGNSVLQTSDSGFLIVGHTALSSGEECDGYVVKTDADGREIWRTVVGTDLDDVCDGVIELEDGTFLLTGRSEEEASHTFKVLFAKLSPDGALIFLKQLHTEIPSVGYRIARAADGNFLIAGYSYQPGQLGTDALVLKCTRDGVVIWSRNTGTDQNDRAYAVVPTPDGGCVAVGGSNDLMDQPIQMAAYRFDESGVLMNSNTHLSTSGNGFLYDAMLAPNGQIMVAGTQIATPGQTHKAVLGILRDDLVIEEWRAAAFQVNARATAMLYDGAGSFVLCGKTNPTADESNIFVAKMPAEAGAGDAKEVSESSFLLFPNPMHTFIYLKIGSSLQRKTWILSTMDGKEVRRTAFEGNELFVYRQGLASGYYVYKVLNASGETMASGKLLLD